MGLKSACKYITFFVTNRFAISLTHFSSLNEFYHCHISIFSALYNTGSVRYCYCTCYMYSRLLLITHRLSLGHSIKLLRLIGSTLKICLIISSMSCTDVIRLMESVCTLSFNQRSYVSIPNCLQIFRIFLIYGFLNFLLIFYYPILFIPALLAEAFHTISPSHLNYIYI